MRNDGLQPPALLALYLLAHLRAPARKSKGVGSDSIGANLRAGRDGHRDFRSIHRLDIAIGDNPAPNRVRGCGDCVSSDHRDRTLEITLIVLLIAVWLLAALSAVTVMIAWIAQFVNPAHGDHVPSQFGEAESGSDRNCSTRP